MKNKITIILIVAASIAAGVFCSQLFLQSEEMSVETPVRGTKVVRTETPGSVKKVKEISLVKKSDGRHAIHIVETQVARPGAAAVSEPKSEDVDEDNLTAAQKTVLKELQDALDDNNIRRVRAVLKKFHAKVDAGGLSGDVPVCMRAKAVEALGWFGKDAAVDLVEFVADANEEVSNDAFSAFEQALSDCEMGDQERAKLVTSMMTALSDADQIDTLLNQLNDMRNSVKAATASEILTTGTDAAKAKMVEEMEFYFDEDVTDASTLEKWKVMNPDDPDDAETYGGAK